MTTEVATKPFNRIEYQREWRSKNQDKVKTYRAKHRAWVRKVVGRELSYRREYRSRHPEQCIIDAARERARNSSLEFTITAKDIVIPQTCPVLGIPIVASKKRATDSSPSLDRINPELGYVQGNICVMSLRANRIKNDGTADEHTRIAEFMRNHSAGK